MTISGLLCDTSECQRVIPILGLKNIVNFRKNILLFINGEADLILRSSRCIEFCQIVEAFVIVRSLLVAHCQY